MLLEPPKRRQAERILGLVAENQAMPGSGFVKPAHFLAKIGQLVIKLGVRFQAERIDFERLVIESSPV
jgi:hypothetical protein